MSEQDNGNLDMDDLEDIVGDLESSAEAEVEVKAKPKSRKAAKRAAPKKVREVEPASRANRSASNALREQPRVDIIVAESHDPNELGYVFASVNGVGYQIQRGVKVSVPESVLEVLDNAIQSSLVADPTDRNNRRKIQRDFPRFPYRRV